MWTSATRSPDQSIAVSVVPMPRRAGILSGPAGNLGVRLGDRAAEHLEQLTGATRCHGRAATR